MSDYEGGSEIITLSQKHIFTKNFKTLCL